MFCTVDGLEKLACRACVSRSVRRNKIRGSYGTLNAKMHWTGSDRPAMMPQRKSRRIRCTRGNTHIFLQYDFYEK